MELMMWTWSFKHMLVSVFWAKKVNKLQGLLITQLVNLSFWSLFYLFMEENAIGETLSWCFILFIKISCIFAVNMCLDLCRVSVAKCYTSLSFTRCIIFALPPYQLCTTHSLIGNSKKKISWRKSISTKLVLNTPALTCSCLLTGYSMVSFNA